MDVLSNIVLGLFLNVVASIDNSFARAHRELSYVVSTSNGSEEFYLKLKRLRARNERSPVREDIICDIILKSAFLTINDKLSMVDPYDLEAYSLYHPEMIDWYMFTRPYEKLNVSVPPGSIQHREAVFPCLGKVEGKSELKMYLVSHAYDFNRWVDDFWNLKYCCDPRVRGHFVFEYSREERMGKLVAIAEEPVYSLGHFAHDHERYSPSEMQKYFDRISERSNQICEFTRGHKVRICAVALNGDVEFRPGDGFQPYENRIEPECEKRDLEYTHQKPAMFQFNEWVIGCKVERVGERGTFDTQYISLGGRSYQFLLYKAIEGRGNVSNLVYHFSSYLGVGNEGR